MSNGLHLKLDKKTIDSAEFSQGVLTLKKAGPFTVQIKEYLELLQRKAKLNPSQKKEFTEISASIAKFEKTDWVWNTVRSLHSTNYTKNNFVQRESIANGKQFNFPKVLEGGGYCYVEAFFEGESPIGSIPNGMLVRAMGVPRLIRIEWTDMQYNPITSTKVAFGSHLLLHIYTEGMYGQEILVGLRDINGIDDDLNIANSSYFEREVQTYPLKPFEQQKGGVSGSLGKGNKKESATNVQKAEIEVGIDYAWLFAGEDLEIQVKVLQKDTRNTLGTGDSKNILNVSEKGGKKFSHTQEITNMPVVVGEIDTVAKPPKKPINFTFGVFIDGTLNNMYNTELRQMAEGKNPANTTGFAMSKSEAAKLFSTLKEKDNSYDNDLSNPAILFKNYTKDPGNKVFKVYTDGMGTNTSPAIPEKTDANPNPVRDTNLNKEDYKKDDLMFGPAFGQGSAGIMDRVKKSIEDVVSIIKAQKLDKDHCVGTITFDVFGFSRGAASARHFVHVVTHGPYVAKMGLVYAVEDLQNNSLPLSYKNKLMPQFGVLGQLLTEAGLMDEALTKVDVRFVGIYDTVPHHGFVQHNDAKDLGLDNVNRANYVVHMVAADEHRANFSLVDISTVAKVPADSKKKGGIELSFPGVHCDVGGAYEEGRIDNPLRIDADTSEEALKPLRNELIQQGWFKNDEIKIILNPLLKLSSGVNRFRLEGKRKLSNQYSYIPLHHMAEFCKKRDVPIKQSSLYEFKYFKPNFIDNLPNVEYKNVAFLEEIKTKLENYCFNGGSPLSFEKDPKAVSFLRNHYLHWNSTYGEEGMDVGIQTNYPNKVDGKRQRKVR